MDVRPKRRKYEDNPYSLSSDIKNGLYYVSFKDSRGIKQCIKINQTIFEELNRFELKDVSQMNEFDRHIEHIYMTDEQLYNRLIDKSDGFSNNVFDKILIKELMNEIKKLPEIQKRRLIKYYLYGMSYEKIAKEENCTKRSVKFSVDIAIEKISKKF